MNPLDFIGDKLKQFGSDIANGTTDAFDAATNALGSVFGGTKPTTTPTAPAQTLTPQTTNVNNNQSLALQNSQDQQPKPLSTSAFNQPQAPTQTQITAPKPLQTNLINFSNPTNLPIPTSTTIKMTGKPSPNKEPALLSQFTNLVASPVNVAKGVYQQVK